MRDTQTRLEEAEKKIREPSFRKNKGLGNEVGYYVFDYPAKDEMIVREWARRLREKNNPYADGFRIAVFDLYDIMIDMLEQEGYLEQCFDMEERSGMGEIAEAVVDLLQLGQHDGYLYEHIRNNAPPGSILILAGVGKCYPVLRSHHALNNLHQIFDELPVVLLYPGKYDGQQLVLFGTLKDDNYYRAFRLAGDM